MRNNDLAGSRSLDSSMCGYGDYVSGGSVARERMTELIKQLETATEGSRELDYRVLIKLGWRHEAERFPGCVKPLVTWYRPGKLAPSTDGAPKVTTSLDAALELVPEGYSVEIWVVNSSSSTAHLRPEKQRFSISPAIGAAGHTPALALCAAILKARENEQDI